MATLVSLDDAIYSLAYWFGVACNAASGSTNLTDLANYGTATATNAVTNASLATVSPGYSMVSQSQV